jgi:hypothetical protein
VSARAATLPALTTERLALRGAPAADLDDLWAIWRDPDVRRYGLDQPSEGPVGLITSRATPEESARCRGAFMLPILPASSSELWR